MIIHFADIFMHHQGGPLPESMLTQIYVAM